AQPGDHALNAIQICVIGAGDRGQNTNNRKWPPASCVLDSADSPTSASNDPLTPPRNFCDASSQPSNDTWRRGNPARTIFSALRSSLSPLVVTAARTFR